MLRIGTRHVQFVCRDSFSLIENLDGSFVVLPGIAEYVGKHDDVLDLAQLGQLFINKGSGPDILQSDRVQHSRSRLEQARRRISRHRLLRKSLYHEAAKPVEVHHVLELNPVSKRAAGRDHRIFQLDAGKADTQIMTPRAIVARWRH